jgi:hypothetical protein
MLYETIALHLLENRPEIHEQLRRNKQVLATMQLLAQQLKSSHELAKEQLLQRWPDSDPSQIASEAMEIAVMEVEALLPAAYPLPENDFPSLYEAIAFALTHSLPA